MSKDLLVYNFVGFAFILVVALVLYFFVLPMSHSEGDLVFWGNILFVVGLISILMAFASMVDETIRTEIISYIKTYLKNKIKKNSY